MWRNGKWISDAIVFGTIPGDTIVRALATGPENLIGSGQDDVFVPRVDEQTDIISGGGGRDTVDYERSDRGLSIDLTAGRVTATFSQGGEHTAVVATLSSIENATGSDFADTIVGTGNFNTIDGGYGNDVLDGGGGLDTLSYESHDRQQIGAGDLFVISLGMNGHDGNTNRIALVSNDFVQQEFDVLRNFQNVIGSNNHESITGNEKDNLLNGRGGDDFLSGGLGNDTLLGGDGKDILFGGAGVDTMTGGAGADKFLFTSAADSPSSALADLITDFEHGVDTIDLSFLDADSTTPGQQHFLSFSDAFFPDRGQISLNYDAQHNVTTILANTTNGAPDFHLDVFGFVTQSDLHL